VLRAVKWAVLSIAVLGFVTAQSRGQVVIVYEGTLLDGMTEFDSVSSSGTFNDPATAQYWSFWGNQGDTVTIEVNRLESAFDPALWVFEGVFADTSAFSGGSNNGFDDFDPGWLKFADDEIDVPGQDDNGDPRAFVNLTLPNLGQYTVAVTNFASGSNDGGDGRFDYQITASDTQNPPASVPEPSSLALGILGTLAMVTAVAVQRRRIEKRQSAPGRSRTVTSSAAD
jgi:hypothetical protein